MKLTDEQQKQFLAFINAKWRPSSCGICKQNSWGLPQHVYEMREFHGGTLVIGGSPIVPVCPVVCNICGNTVLVNALIAGLDLSQAKQEIVPPPQTNPEPPMGNL